MVMQQQKKGVLFALAAYAVWGVAPIYFKLVQEVPAIEILCHRMLWSFLFMLLLITLGRNWSKVNQVWQDKKKVALLAGTATIISANWLLFIWAINNGHMLETSLGYFINPLINILLGMLFLGERFRPMQWCAFVLAFSGVAVQLWQFGSVPIIGLALAISFGLYTLLRKKVEIDAQVVMLFETLWMAPIALIYLLFIAQTPTSNLLHNSWTLNLLLMLAGTITMIPLLFFKAATSYLRLSTLGFFQYIAPTMVMLLAVFVYGETLKADNLLTFSFIWIALILFTLDAFYTQLKLRPHQQCYTPDKCATK